MTTISLDTYRTKVWLKTYGCLKEDGWWSIVPKHICGRLHEVVRWELAREDWVLEPNGAISIYIDWDGDISYLDPVLVMSEMDIIGAINGLSGWSPFKQLSSSDEVYVMFKLHNYHSMVNS